MAASRHFESVREYADKCMCVCWRTKLDVGQKMMIEFDFTLISNTVVIEPNHAEHTADPNTHTPARVPPPQPPPPPPQYLSAHPKPLPGSRSQLVTWTLKLPQSSSLSLSFSLPVSLLLQEDRLSKSEGSPGRCRLRGFGVPIHRK